MTFRFTHRTRFPVPPREAYAVVTDPAYQEEKAVHLGADRGQCTVTSEGGRVVMSLETVRPARFGDNKEQHATMTMWLDPERLDGTWARVQHGYEKRASAKGTCRLVPDGNGTILEVTGEISIRVPMLGTMIEKRIAKAMNAETLEEDRFNARWCERERAA